MLWPPAAHRDLEAGRVGHPDRGRHLLGRAAPGDQRREPVDGAVPDVPGLVVAGIARAQDLAQAVVGDGAGLCGHGDPPCRIGARTVSDWCRIGASPPSTSGLGRAHPVFVGVVADPAWAAHCSRDGRPGGPHGGGGRAGLRRCQVGRRPVPHRPAGDRPDGPQRPLVRVRGRSRDDVRDQRLPRRGRATSGCSPAPRARVRQRGPNHMPDLARSAGGVATIAEATGGDPASSARWRDVIVPSGLDPRAAGRLPRRSPRLGGARPPPRRRCRRLHRRGCRPSCGGSRRRSPRGSGGCSSASTSTTPRTPARPASSCSAAIALEIRTATNAARYWLESLDDGGFGRQPPHGGACRPRGAARARPAVAALRARTRRAGGSRSPPRSPTTARRDSGTSASSSSRAGRPRSPRSSARRTASRTARPTSCCSSRQGTRTRRSPGTSGSPRTP